MTLPIAHPGHWAVNLLYALPVAVLIMALVRQRRIEAARDAEADGVSDSAAAGHEPDPPV